MAVGFSKTNKPLNPRGLDASPKGYNRAALYSGKALDFDGVNDYVDLGQNLGFINTGDFTLLANAKFDVLSGDEPIMGQGSGSTGNAALALVNALGKLRFAFYGDDLDWDEPIQTGKWYSLAFTFNRTTKARAIYVNGQLAVSDVTTLTPNATGNTFVIGKVPYLSTYADAQITGVKAFNTALTAAQVADLYNNPEKIVPTGVADSALKLWLPMMEGAGTTAYDGSGNGNHGTISGATWTHGIGAPVAQTAVIDWNKGTNLVLYSEEFDNVYWNKSSQISLTANVVTAPDGQTTADKITNTTSGSNPVIYSNAITTTATTDYVVSVYAKSAGKDWICVRDINDANPRVWFNVSTGTIGTEITATGTIEDAGNGWYKCSVYNNGASTTSGRAVFLSVDADNSLTGTPSGTDGLYIWGASVEQASSVGPYVRTEATAQTSDVLLPQGLTSGRDITGVNLFENVRKQGALNLDGNSWAEVHDNASLDFGTGSFTLECWSKAKYTSSGSIYNVLLTLGDNVSSGSTSSLYIDSSLNYTFRYDSTLIVAGGSSEGDWSHVVGVYDGTNINIYLNGSFVVQTAATATSKTNAYSKRIGTDTAGASRAYKDQIAQPRIYNRALTAEEVLQNYNSGKSIYQ